MSSASMTSKGQLTVPVDVRRKLGLVPGTRVEFVEVDAGRFQLFVPQLALRDLKGRLPMPDRVVTLEQMDEAVASGARTSMA